MGNNLSQQQGLVDLNEWKRSRSGCKRTRLPVPIPLDVQRPLDRAMHTNFVRWRGDDGQVPDRRVQKVNEGHAKPWRRIADFLYLARVCGVEYVHAIAVVRALESWVNSLYGKSAMSAPELSKRIHEALDDKQPPRAA